MNPKSPLQLPVLAATQSIDSPSLHTADHLSKQKSLAQQLTMFLIENKENLPPSPVLSQRASKSAKGSSVSLIAQQSARREPLSRVEVMTVRL